MAKCRECGEKISGETAYCNLCGGKFHYECLGTRAVEHSKFYEWITGKSFHYVKLCGTCCEKWDRKYD